MFFASRDQRRPRLARFHHRRLGWQTILNAPTVIFANAVTQVGMPQVAAALGDGKSGFISEFAAKGGGCLR